MKSSPSETTSQTFLLRVDAAAALVDVGDLDGLADLELALVGLLLADDHPEQRGLADAVGADHADDAGAGQRERRGRA